MGHKGRNRKKYQDRLKMSNQSMSHSHGESSFGGNPTPTLYGYTAPVDGGYAAALALGPSSSLSPNRGMHLNSGSGTSVGAPTLMFRPPFHMLHQDRRSMIGIGPPVESGMDVLGIGGPRLPTGGYLAPHFSPILDPLEFPSLSSRNLGQGDSFHSVGLVRPYQAETSAFTMSSEDFPALPGSSPTTTKTDSTGKDTPSTSTVSTSDSPLQGNSSSSHKPITKGEITTLPDGTLTNIPEFMVKDQFGMAGLLTTIRNAKINQELVSLALGFDLTTLGLDLNATDSLYHTFGGPWGEAPIRAEEKEYPVPPEYSISERFINGHDSGNNLREKLCPMKLVRYKDDLLFYIFYKYPGDILQVLSASELYNRDWRYHMQEQIWITRVPGIQAIEKGINFEKGTYYYFNTNSWKKVHKEMYLDYSKLEERPTIPHEYANAYGKN